MKTLLALAAVGTLALASASAAVAAPTFALDPNLVAQATHFETCLSLLVTAPAQHAIQCGPSRSGVVFVHAGGDGCTPGACPKKP